jgi:hypothetical protein
MAVQRRWHHLARVVRAPRVDDLPLGRLVREEPDREAIADQSRVGVATLRAMAALGKLLDWSVARPPLAQVAAHGYVAAYRYVCSDVAEAGLPGKRLAPKERDAILAAGLDIGLHGEDNAGAAQGGYSRGLAQGRQWADYAHGVLRAPTGMTIVAAIDYDTQGVYPRVVQDYLHGVTDGLQGEYVTGVYGSIYVVDGALGQHDAVHGVQTIAWSHSKISTWAHLYQHGGSEFPGTDYNDVFRIPHGTWLQTLGEDMPTANEIAAAVWARGVKNDATGVVQSAADRLVGAQANSSDARDQAAAALRQARANGVSIAQIITTLGNLQLTLSPDDITAIAHAILAALPTDLAAQLVTEMAADLKIELSVAGA